MDLASRSQQGAGMPSSPEGAVQEPPAWRRRKEAQDLASEDWLVAGSHSLACEFSGRQSHEWG
jgi:hypothetical protein